MTLLREEQSNRPSIEPRLLAGLDPRYRVHSLIGEGVSARVYRGSDRVTDAEVAIKLLNPHLHTDPISVERFKREIRITRILNHPQIVSIYDLVCNEQQIYLVMEFIDGLDLKQYLQLNDPISFESVCSILEQLLDILALCHQKNVIHRDLKPQNIKVCRGTPGNPYSKLKLLDFGISRMTGLADLTQTGTSLGSPEYMAPELFASNVFDPRTDVWAIGVVIYELASGKLPFSGATLPMLVKTILDETPVPLDQLRPDIPDWFGAMVARMLAKKPCDRYHGMEEIRFDFEQRQVVANRRPTLPRRSCLHCGEETLAEVPTCLACGKEPQLGGDPNEWIDLHYDRVDSNRIVCFLEKYFPDHLRPQRMHSKLLKYVPGHWNHTSQAPPKSRADGVLSQALRICIRLLVSLTTTRKRLLLRGLSDETSKIIRDRAQLEGLYLDARRRPFWLRVRVLSVSVPLCLIAFLLGRHYAWHILLFVDPKVIVNGVPLNMELIGGYLLFLLSLLAAIVVQLCLLRPALRRPLITNGSARIANLGASRQWISQLADAFKRHHPAELKDQRIQLIEHCLLLDRSDSAQGGDAMVTARLRELVSANVRLMDLVDTLSMDPSKLEADHRQYHQLSLQLKRATDPETISKLKTARAAVEERLEQHAKAEETQSRLFNKQIRFRALFNQLAARQLALGQELDANQLDPMQELLDNITSELEVARRTAMAIGTSSTATAGAHGVTDRE